MNIPASDLEHLRKILDTWDASFIPEGTTVAHEQNAAVFRDKNGVPRMAMPWEDYEAILKWKREQK